MKRLLLVLALALVCAAPALAKTVTVSVSQIVEHPALDAVRNGFIKQMEDDGYEVKANVHIAQGNPATNVQIAAQILGENPDIVLAIATPSAQACAQKIKDIPILATAVTDLVGAGLVESMDKPGANVTGMTDMSPVAEQLELAMEIVPGIKKIGVIYNAGEANSVTLVKVLTEEATKRGIAVEGANAANSGAVYQAAKSLVGRVDAVYIPTDNTVVSALESAIKVCREAKLPLFSGDTDSVERGTIASLAVDYYRMGLQTAKMAQRILDGADPATMPVEKLEDLQLYVNVKAAEGMGVTVPQAVIDRADKVVK